MDEAYKTEGEGGKSLSVSKKAVMPNCFAGYLRL